MPAMHRMRLLVVEAYLVRRDASRVASKPPAASAGAAAQPGFATLVFGKEQFQSNTRLSRVLYRDVSRLN
jgi:hypothetical protein